MIHIPGGFLYTPDDLGFNAVNLPPAGVIVNGLTVPCQELGAIRSVSIIREMAIAGGTPMDIFQESIGSQGVQWSDGLINSTLWGAITNNPRTQWFHVTRGQTVLTASTGTSNAGEFAKLFSSPYIRLAARNTDAAIAIVVTITMILWTT